MDVLHDHRSQFKQKFGLNHRQRGKSSTNVGTVLWREFLLHPDTFPGDHIHQGLMEQCAVDKRPSQIGQAARLQLLSAAHRFRRDGQEQRNLCCVQIGKGPSSIGEVLLGKLRHTALQNDAADGVQQVIVQHAHA